LSSGWYKDHPQIEISGRLKSVELNIIAQDYKVIMQILELNMTEGQNEFKKPKKSIPVVSPTEPTRGKKKVFFTCRLQSLPTPKQSRVTNKINLSRTFIKNSDGNIKARLFHNFTIKPKSYVM
jgi:hypothetical protein